MEARGNFLERIALWVYRNLQANPTWLVVPVGLFFLVVGFPIIDLSVYVGSLFLPGLSDFSNAVEVSLVALACATTAGGVGLLANRKRIGKALAWMAKADGRPPPDEAWRLFVQMPRWLMTGTMLAVSVAYLAVVVPFAASVADLSFTGVLAFAVVMEIGVAFGWLLATFWVEFVMRPAIQELDVELPPEAERQALTWSLRSRILLPLPVVAAVTGLVTGAVVVGVSDSGDVQLLAAGLAAALCGVLLTLLITGAVSDLMVRPIADLTAGAERVATGDLNESVSVTGGDELGALTNTFNQMQVGLRERGFAWRARGAARRGCRIPRPHRQRRRRPAPPGRAQPPRRGAATARLPGIAPEPARGSGQP